MGNRREYDIAFVGLKPGIHEFNYRVDDQFFANNTEKEASDIGFNNCDALIKLTLEKNNSFLLLKFEIFNHLE